MLDPPVLRYAGHPKRIVDLVGLGRHRDHVGNRKRGQHRSTRPLATRDHLNRFAEHDFLGLSSVPPVETGDGTKLGVLKVLNRPRVPDAQLDCTYPGQLAEPLYETTVKQSLEHNVLPRPDKQEV